MANELIYRLSDPNYTIYHRAALGGLAATLEAWRKPWGRPPAGIAYEVTPDRVRLGWEVALGEQEALRRILDASFRLTEDKLIELVGHGLPAGDGALGRRLAIHNGLCSTFLQHNQMRPSEKQARQVTLEDPDGERQHVFTYKAVTSYAHQRAKGTGLLDEDGKKSTAGRLPALAKVPQSVVPGAMKGACELQARPEEVILLLYLMVGSAVYLLRPRTRTEKMQACVVVPDVVDLRQFARAVHRLASVELVGFARGYLNRIVGGAEEAAMRLLVDLAAEVREDASIAGLQAIAMGKVAWDKKQVNRSTSVRLGLHYDELAVFQAARTHLGGRKIIKGSKGDAYAVLESPLPELVAANLASRRHWAAHFRSLVADKRDFSHMRFARKGLHQMQGAIRDEDDQAVIEMFQSAWRRVMGEFGDRARSEGGSFERLVEVEQERVRNSILRAKTADALAGWFLRFCADATRGAPLGPAQKQATRLRQFLFSPRNADRLQNLLLFALVSYAKDETKAQTDGGE